MSWNRNDLLEAIREREGYDRKMANVSTPLQHSFATAFPALSRILDSLERDFRRSERSGGTQPSPKPYYGGGGGTTLPTNSV